MPSHGTCTWYQVPVPGTRYLVPGTAESGVLQVCRIARTAESAVSRAVCAAETAENSFLVDDFNRNKE